MQRKPRVLEYFNINLLIIWAVSIFQYSIYLGLYLIPEFRHDFFGSLTSFIVFHFFFILYVFCFYLAISTDPGSPPEDRLWRRDAETVQQNPDLEPSFQLTDIDRQTLNIFRHLPFGSDMESKQELVERMHSIPLVEREASEDDEKDFCDQLRYCYHEYCRWVKPDRCHHCSQCNRCTLRMDHHCFWVANCVGYMNHKYWMLMILYSILTSLTICFSMAHRLVRAFKPIWDVEYFIQGDLWIIISYFGSIAIIIFVGIFFSCHFMMIVRNTTTLESIFQENAANPRSIKGLSVKKVYALGQNAWMCHFKYDRGPYANFCEIFGEHWYLWFLPSWQKTLDDGTFFYVEKRKNRMESSLSSLLDPNLVHS